MTQKSNKELIKEEPKAVATQPEAKRGFESDVGREDIIIPRARLLQALSPDLEDNDTLKAGMIINSLTKEVLPETFIPIIYSSNWIRFNPRNKEDAGYDASYSPGDIIWTSTDPEDPRVVAESQFGPNGELPLATKFHNFLSYFPGCAMPVVLSFSKTSFKTGKELLSLLKFTPGDIWSRAYKLTAIKKENDKGKFFVLKTGIHGIAKAEDAKLAEQWYEDFKHKEIKMDEPEVI